MTGVRPLRAYAEVALGRQRSPVHDSGPFMVPYLRAANVKDGELDLSDVKQMNFSPSEQHIFALKNGDTLVTEGSGSLGAVGASAVWSDDLPGTHCFQNTLLRLRPRPGTDPRFLAWWARYAFADGLFASVATGANIFHVSAQRVRALPMTYLAPPEQRAIADYLDRETARIDALIAAKRHAVGLLIEREATLIHERTSRGLASAPLTPSGQSWLGAIPSHWQIMQIRRLAVVRRGASPRPIDDPVYFDEDGEYAWVRIADVSAAERYLLETTQQLSALGSSLSAKLQPGSLFVSIAASVGKPMITKIKCCVHDGFVYFDRLRMRPNYLYYLFRAGQLFLGLGKLGTQLNLNTETIGGITVPVPPIDEQDAISSCLDGALETSLEVQSTVRRQLTLLNERRRALITAAVTGRITVPVAA